MKHTLDRLLAASAPRAATDSDIVRAEAISMVAEAQAEASSSRRRRRRLWVPVIGIGVVALTAGAAALTEVYIDRFGTTHIGEDLTQVSFSIDYTTHDGRRISCEYEAGGTIGRPWSDEVVARIKSHDWAGVGQKMYDYAVEHPFVPDDGHQVDTADAAGMAARTWLDAESAFIDPVVWQNQTDGFLRTAPDGGSCSAGIQ